MTRYHHAWILAALAAPAGLAGLATPALAQTTVQTSPSTTSGFNNSGITTPGVGSNVSIGTTATSPAATGNSTGGAGTTTTNSGSTTTSGGTIYGPNVVVVPGTYPQQGATVIRNQNGGAAGSTPTGALNGGVPTGALDGGVPGATGGANTTVPGGNVPSTGSAGAGGTAAGAASAGGAAR